MAYEDNEIDIYDADENTDTIWPVKIIKLILMMPEDNKIYIDDAGEDTDTI